MERTRLDIPSAIAAIARDTERMGFTMASEPVTGSLLRTLAASKPGGRMLELGTGTGLGTAWLLAGMDASARLDTIESNARVLAVARRHLKKDPRVHFHMGDAGTFLGEQPKGKLDLVFADTWAGKFTHLDLTLSLLRPGGLYIVDDLLPQPSWPEGHGPKVKELVAELEGRELFVATRMDYATGIMVLVRQPG